MKRLLVLVLIAVSTVSVYAGPQQEGGGGKKKAIGAIWYQFSDTFISMARNTLNDIVKKEGVYTIQDADSKFDIATETDNMRNMLTKGVNYLVFNTINTNGVENTIREVTGKGATLLITNGNPMTEAAWKISDKVYVVSSMSEQSGVIMGEHAIKYWKAHPEADRNKNGKLDYIMLLGITDHNDTINRATYSISGIEQAGIQTNKIQEVVANYQRVDAMNAVQSIIAARRNDVDFIFACNDDMALGAIEALKAAGFFRDAASFIPVIGVDATAVAQEALRDGTLLGTAFNNPVKLADAAYKTIKLLDEGKSVTTENIAIPGVHVEDRFVVIDYISIDKNNIADAR
ncbi:galactose ABC transporter substrate-binding protein [Spirochaetia bacterium]|nr:galactose ABC transporter substrate-binding protein [Spirochaetia bacterium]